jgi:hypothetical protein
MNPSSRIEIFINDVRIFLEKEEVIRPYYNQIYSAELVQVKKSKLNVTFSKYLPECVRIFRNSNRASGYSISAENAVKSILTQKYHTIQNLEIEFDSKHFYPDGVVIDPNNPKKAKYLLEIKTTLSKSIQNKTKRRSNCLISFAALQALRNSSALILSNMVDEVFPEAVLGEYEIISHKPSDKKIPIIIDRIWIYKIRVCNSYILDKDLAPLIYRYLGG